MTNNQEIVIQQNQGFMQVSSLQNAIDCAEYVCKSGLCPKNFIGKVADIVVAFQMGQELGLKPLQSLQNIAVINGRPSIWGDCMLAICRQSPSFEYIKEEYMEDTKTYVCRVKRKNEPEFIQSFSEEKAKRANLWNKEGPWRQYPERMLQMRARGFALRDAFPDLLRGILIAEEAMDMPKSKVDYSKVGITIDHKEEIANESQINILRELMKDADSNEIDICAFLKIESFDFMTVSMCNDINKQLKKKIAKNKKVEIHNKRIEESIEPKDTIEHKVDLTPEEIDKAYDW